jgi:hypothetical protein
MGKQTYVGIGVAVAAIGAVGLFGARLSGHAGGEGQQAMGCGGEPGMSGAPATGGSVHELSDVDVVAASQKPFVDATVKQLQQALETRHLTAQNLAVAKVWDEDGSVHVVMQQVREGLPIHGAEAMVTFGADGKPLKTEERLIDFPATKLSREEAITAAQKSVHCETCGGMATCDRCTVESPKVEHIGFEMMANTNDMTYRVTMSGADKSGQTTDQTVLVNAVNGGVVSCNTLEKCKWASYLPESLAPGAIKAGQLNERSMMAAPPPSAPQPIAPPRPNGPGPNPDPGPAAR